MADDCIHDHIEDRGGKGVVLRHTLVPLEWASEVSADSGHHGQSAPVRLKESECPGTNPVRCEKLEGFTLIQGIICLLEVQENIEEDRLPHGHKLLEQLGFEGGGPCTTACSKLVQRIVVCDV